MAVHVQAVHPGGGHMLPQHRAFHEGISGEMEHPGISLKVSWSGGLSKHFINLPRMGTNTL